MREGDVLFRYGSSKLRQSRITSVEWLSEGATVYDLQVQNNHNFFANSILSFNCLLVDDPIKNFDDAMSQTVKDKIWLGLWTEDRLGALPALYYLAVLSII